MPKSTVPLILSPSDLERFWSKVNKDGPIPAHCQELGPCWVWQGRLDKHGYGKFACCATTKTFHRVSFFLAYGHWPEPFGLHACDNPPCGNPAHLFEGTHADNMADMARKGRHAGSNHWRARLNDQHIQDIRDQYHQGGETQHALALKYGISQSHVNNILRGRRWKR